MKLAPVADLKTFLDLTVATYDTFLGTLLDQVSLRIENFLNRKMEKVARSVYFNAGRRTYHLPAYPIDLTAALSVTYDGTAQTINDDYWVWEDEGLIEFQSPLSYSEPKQVLIAWTGGYAATENIPSDVQMAVIMQAAFVFRRRKDIGVSSISLPDGSLSVNVPLKLLSEVENMLRPYRRTASMR